MEKILATIKPFVMPLLIASVLGLTYATYTLPARISRALNMPVKDTVTVVKIVTATLSHSGNFIYLDAKPIGKGIRLFDEYQYDPAYPDEPKLVTV